MNDFAIVCKTYRADVRRFARLCSSLERNNPVQFPLVAIVPESDMPIFEPLVRNHRFQLITDESVVAAHPRAVREHLLERYRRTAGYLSQQVVKSEVWRVLGCRNYLCVDADTYFIRPLQSSDFMSAKGDLYSVIGQDKDTFALAYAQLHGEFWEQFARDGAAVRELFERDGPLYSFGPLPVLWSAEVWRRLDEEWLQVRGWTLWDAIDKHPHEAHWYGEFLLHSRAIPLVPIGPLARCYHHQWMQKCWRNLGESDESLASVYIAVVSQSNWDEELDVQPRRSVLSRWARRIKGMWRNN
ncbi:MAG: hypothetical protein RIQ60_2135 [Pseudomonadota bacterium]|jgi:hypothetical protein